MKKKLLKLISTEAKMFSVWGDLHAISETELVCPLIRHDARLKVLGLFWITVTRGKRSKHNAW